MAFKVLWVMTGFLAVIRNILTYSFILSTWLISTQVEVELT
jgi:hypothetical protein